MKLMTHVMSRDRPWVFAAELFTSHLMSTESDVFITLPDTLRCHAITNCVLIIHELCANNGDGMVELSVLSGLCSQHGT